MTRKIYTILSFLWKLLYEYIWKKLIDKNFKNPLYLCQVKGVKWDILINNHKIEFCEL